MSGGFGPDYALHWIFFAATTAMLAHPSPIGRQRGAALLMLMALAGIGAASFLMLALKPQADDLRQEKQTLQAMGEARDALLGYAARHGRLPRPATSALDGNENPRACTDANSCNGFLPWVTLGVTNADSWGKLLRYSVTPVFTQTPVGPLSAGDKVIVGRAGNGLPTYVVGQAQCTLYAQCAPAIIYSSGKYNLGTSTLGIAQAGQVTTNLDEQQNNNTPTYFISRVRSTDSAAPGGEFDDLVTWVPVEQLRARLRITYNR